MMFAFAFGVNNIRLLIIYKENIFWNITVLEKNPNTPIAMTRTIGSFVDKNKNLLSISLFKRKLL